MAAGGVALRGQGLHLAAQLAAFGLGRLQRDAQLLHLGAGGVTLLAQRLDLLGQPGAAGLGLAGRLAQLPGLRPGGFQRRAALGQLAAGRVALLGQGLGLGLRLVQRRAQPGDFALCRPRLPVEPSDQKRAFGILGLRFDPGGKAGGLEPAADFRRRRRPLIERLAPLAQADPVEAVQQTARLQRLQQAQALARGLQNQGLAARRLGPVAQQRHRVGRGDGIARQGLQPREQLFQRRGGRTQAVQLGEIGAVKRPRPQIGGDRRGNHLDPGLLRGLGGQLRGDIGIRLDQQNPRRTAGQAGRQAGARPGSDMHDPRHRLGQIGQHLLDHRGSFLSPAGPSPAGPGAYVIRGPGAPPASGAAARSAGRSAR